MEDSKKVFDTTNDWPRKEKEKLESDEIAKEVLEDSARQEEQYLSYSNIVKAILSTTLERILTLSDENRDILDRYIEAMKQDLDTIKNMSISKEEWEKFGKVINYMILTNRGTKKYEEPITMRMGMINSFGEFSVNFSIEKLDIKK